MVYNYCASKWRLMYLVNLKANFYTNVTPMIEFRECFPFVPTMGSKEDLDGQYDDVGHDRDFDNYHGENKELREKITVFMEI